MEHKGKTLHRGLPIEEAQLPRGEGSTAFQAEGTVWEKNWPCMLESQSIMAGVKPLQATKIKFAFPPLTHTIMENWVGKDLGIHLISLSLLEKGKSRPRELEWPSRSHRSALDHLTKQRPALLSNTASFGGSWGRSKWTWCASSPTPCLWNYGVDLDSLPPPPLTPCKLHREILQQSGILTFWCICSQSNETLQT